MFDLKVINSVMTQLEEERGISGNVVIEAIELALANAYRKEYGKRHQIIKAKFDLNTGSVEFNQIKIVVDRDEVIMEEEKIASVKDDLSKKNEKEEEEEPKIRFNEEHHILLEDAKLIKADAKVGDEITFPLESKDDFGRIAAQTAKQVITQKIREAEKTSVIAEYGEKEGQIVSGTVERMERGSIYLDMGRAIGLLSYEEQIQGERFKQGERIRAYLFKVDETSKGVFLKLSRSHPKFLEELFKSEVPEITQGIVKIKSIAREAGSRSKIAVSSTDEHVDPVGALVGQRGVRVSTVMSELAGEKIDIIEWSEDPAKFVEESLSPANILKIELVERENHFREKEQVAIVTVAEDQQSLAIGKGGQNVRLAAKLTGMKIDIVSTDTPTDLETDEEKNISEETMEEKQLATK
jgi:transcription termination/antitermination protein NusA